MKSKLSLNQIEPKEAKAHIEQDVYCSACDLLLGKLLSLVSDDSYEVIVSCPLCEDESWTLSCQGKWTLLPNDSLVIDKIDSNPDTNESRICLKKLNS